MRQAALSCLRRVVSLSRQKVSQAQRDLWYVRFGEEGGDGVAVVLSHAVDVVRPPLLRVKCNRQALAAAQRGQALPVREGDDLILRPVEQQNRARLDGA